MAENRMTSVPSPEGRRILAAVVTHEAGERIQAWRDQHDPEQAKRLPPHATLCYWAPAVAAEVLERQVRHAFPHSLEVRLGNVLRGTNDQETLYLELPDHDQLDIALDRLYDGTYVALPRREGEWQWHITCVRDSRGRDQDALMAAAAELRLPTPWTLDTVAYLELREGIYRPLALWRLPDRDGQPG